MANETSAYIQRNPGDLISAADWNRMQVKIKEDIAKQVSEAIKNLTKVPNSGNADTLENKAFDELKRLILSEAEKILPMRAGYMRVFKMLSSQKETLIQHDDLKTNPNDELSGYPIVDIYQLDRFDVICSEDDTKSKDQVLFYLYHTREGHIRIKDGTTQLAAVIEDTENGVPFRVKFSDMLSLYKVNYNDDRSLADLENEFWKTFLASPNDEFSEAEIENYCHSPWFDRCCGEKRTVADLHQKGDWDDLWFKVKPRKTINATDTQAPTQVQVRQYDLNTVGLKLLGNAADLPVMVILKV